MHVPGAYCGYREISDNSLLSFHATKPVQKASVSAPKCTDTGQARHKQVASRDQSVFLVSLPAGVKVIEERQKKVPGQEIEP